MSSCRSAAAAGADYLGVTVWATATKAEASPLGLHGLRAVVDATDLPVVAIGGIDGVNAREVLLAGAAGVAVVSAVGGAGDPVAATRELVEAIGEEAVTPSVCSAMRSRPGPVSRNAPR